MTKTITPFVIEPKNYEEEGRAGHLRVAAKVHGYWSSDPVALRVTRKLNYKTVDETEPVWEFHMEHSSGGRDPKVEPDDLLAAECFSEAMQALVDLGHELRGRAVRYFEANYQKQRREYEEARATEKAEKEARVQKDSPLGIVNARNLMAKCKEKHLSNVTVYSRGNDRASYMLQCQNYERTVWRLNGVVTPKGEVEVLLAESSHRTNIVGDAS